jgi:tRNA-splicing ligase RtcB (3'-phosphate/5'-hydroxy nucleic acid ligase)
MELKGKYGKAIIYNDFVEETAMSQIINLINQPMSEGANVRIMPDVHAGAGCVIGYTAKLTDKVVPNLIGVDIGCGVTAVKMMNKVDLGDFNTHISEVIPVGRNTHKEPMGDISSSFGENLKSACDRTNQKYDYVRNSLGTLGGGNHFMEIDVDTNGDWWFIVHSGSRNFGLKTALFFQKIAEKYNYAEEITEIKEKYTGKDISKYIKLIPKRQKGLEWLEDGDLQDYLNHVWFAQLYAKKNRDLIISLALGGNISNGYIESVHNYIDTKNGVIRKGAISAQKGEHVIIPLNMRDGCIIGIGKGNPEWNYSAPHGAGRLMSRSQAKKTLSLDEFKNTMKGVYSTCISESTLDEAPMAYKDGSDIVKYIEPTVDIKDCMKPIWNYKG